MIRIRREEPGDVDAIRRVNDAAFGQVTEGELVDALRGTARPFLSLVAEKDGEVIGHICFTPVQLVPEGENPVTILGLAPMAVLPRWQRQGVGTRLVEAGLEECRRAGFGAVVVLGHPEYYPRFGFEPAVPKGITSEYDVPEPFFMIAELIPGATTRLQGVASYHPVFRRFA